MTRGSQLCWMDRGWRIILPAGSPFLRSAASKPALLRKTKNSGPCRAATNVSRMQLPGSGATILTLLHLRQLFSRHRAVPISLDTGPEQSAQYRLTRSLWMPLEIAPDLVGDLVDLPLGLLQSGLGLRGPRGSLAFSPGRFIACPLCPFRSLEPAHDPVAPSASRCGDLPGTRPRPVHAQTVARLAILIPLGSVLS
jgi:hypothetical protein